MARGPRPYSATTRVGGLVGNGVEATLSVALREDEHDDTVTLSFRGVTVAITLRERQYATRQKLDPDTVLVLIDQDDNPRRDHPVAVYLNDDVLVDTGR